MTTVTETEFAARAAELLGLAEAGEVVVVQRNGRPFARLEPEGAQVGGDRTTDEAVALPDDIFTVELPRKPLTEFRFTTATVTLRERHPKSISPGSRTIHPNKLPE